MSVAKADKWNQLFQTVEEVDVQFASLVNVVADSFQDHHLDEFLSHDGLGGDENSGCGVTV